MLISNSRAISRSVYLKFFELSAANSAGMFTEVSSSEPEPKKLIEGKCLCEGTTHRPSIRSPCRGTVSMGEWTVPYNKTGDCAQCATCFKALHLILERLDSALQYDCWRCVAGCRYLKQRVGCCYVIVSSGINIEHTYLAGNPISWRAPEISKVSSTNSAELETLGVHH